jgi:hypothetical protein
MKKKTTYKKKVNRWSPEERQEFADGVRLRAQTIPNKKRIAGRQACRGRVAAA